VAAACLAACSLVSAASGVSAAPDAPISISSVSASFFPNPADSATFSASPSTAVTFTQEFPSLNFNTPNGTVPCSQPTGVTPDSRPFTDVVIQSDGSCKAIVAGNPTHQAAKDDLANFQAVFTGTFQVAAAGRITFSMYSDDGWILSLGPAVQGGGQPTYVSGQMLSPPTDRRGPFTGYQVVGSYNVESAPNQNNLVVAFPAGGSYPFELDYTDCCEGTQALTVLANGAPIPPTADLALDVQGVSVDTPVQGVAHIQVVPTAGQASQVELLVDGKSVDVKKSPPFAFDWDTSSVSPGPHNVVFRGTDMSGIPIDKQMTLQVLAAAGAATPVATPVAAVLPPQQTEPTSNNNNTLVIVAASLLLILALIGAALYFFLVYRRTARPAPVPPVVAAPVANDNTEFIGRVPVADLTVVGARRPAPQSLPKARLLIKPDREVQLSRSTDTVIGRDTQNAAYVDDRQASRKHARISCVDGDFWIEDLNSLNGTRVNGVTVAAPQKLADKDLINVGDTNITFAVEPA
jgi:hypothetical protein